MLFGGWGKKISSSGGRKGKKHYSALLRESDRLQSALRTILPCKNIIPHFA